MKEKVILFIITSIILVFGVGNAKEKNFPVLKGPYLGQKPPDDIPIIYSTRILSKIEIIDIPVFVRNGGVLIFKGKCEDMNGVFIMEQKNNFWLEPQKIMTLSPFEDRHFFLTTNKKKLYFTSRRSRRPGNKATDDSNLWVLENTTSGWSEPHPLEFPVNTKKPEYYSTVTQDGTLYFTRSLGEGDADIYRSRLVKGKFSKVEKLGKIINSKYVDADPYISPDETYLIFLSNKPGGLGQHDFYISYQMSDRSWTKPKHLGNEINSKGNEVCPLVTPDGKFFFFASNRSGKYEVYWVDAKFIEKIKKHCI